MSWPVQATAFTRRVSTTLNLESIANLGLTTVEILFFPFLQVCRIQALKQQNLLIGTRVVQHMTAGVVTMVCFVENLPFTYLSVTGAILTWKTK